MSTIVYCSFVSCTATIKRFKGSTRHYSFQNYVTLHQKAHNELEELGEPVSKTKKVSEFLKYISDPTLQMGMQIVMGDPAKLDNFELCQQYLSTLQTNTEQQRRNKHNISGVSGELQGSTKKPKDRYYSSEEWHELGSAGRDVVNALRSARGRTQAGRGGGREGRGGRNGRAIPNPRGGNAGNQFGRNAHGRGHAGR